jgi:hypothetical protein
MLIGLLSLVLAGCSSDGSGSATTKASTTQSTATTATSESTEPTQGPAATTSTTLEPTGTTSGRPAAPDFTLELGDGGDFTLSEGTKPVYLVFWAEW